MTDLEASIVYYNKDMGSCCVPKSTIKRKTNLIKEIKRNSVIKFPVHEGSIMDQYELVNKIGEGATSIVKCMVSKASKIPRAVKSVSISNEKYLRKALREIEILKKFEYPTLLKGIESYRDTEFMHIVTELYTGESLFELLKDGKGLNETLACKLMCYIISGINHLHSLGIMHRDIKPENIIFETPETSSYLKIIDFGSAKLIKKQFYKKKCGTVLYMSPQVIDGKYTEKCDVWSAGIIFYIMIAGKHPFYTNIEQDLLEKIRYLPVQFKSKNWEFVSPDTINLISQMLEKEEKNRPSISEVLKNKALSIPEAISILNYLS
jgi:calcium-dependent protein kinase